MNYETPVYLNDLEVEVLHGVLAEYVARNGEERFFSNIIEQLSHILTSEVH